MLELVNNMETSVRMIENMQGTVSAQSGSVEDTREKFNHIADNIINMEEKCGRLDEAAKRMEDSRNAIVRMIGNLSAISEENAACMEEAAASVTEEARAIEKVSESSTQVAALADKLTAQIDHFKID